MLIEIAVYLLAIGVFCAVLTAHAVDVLARQFHRETQRIFSDTPKEQSHDRR